jgi:hypothetical protein
MGKKFVIILMGLFLFNFVSGYNHNINTYCNPDVSPDCAENFTDGCVTSESLTLDGRAYNFSKGICLFGEYFLTNNNHILNRGLVFDCNGSILIGEGNEIGIGVFGAENLTLKNCNVQNYSVGIFLSYSGSVGSGTQPVIESNNNLIKNNNLENNLEGLTSIGGQCTFSSTKNCNKGNKIVNNVFENNSLGIKLEYSINSNISENTFNNNYNVGTSIEEFTSGNFLYHNNFLGDSIHAVDLTENNSWNISGQGNYWENYDSGKEGCIDNDLNIICDEAYSISDAKDFFPYKIQNGWKEDICRGEIQVFAEESNSVGIENLKVFLDYNFKNFTDKLGILNIPIADSCGKFQNIQVKCSDNTLCEEKNISIDFPDEEDALVFDCTKCTGKTDLFISQSDVNFYFNKDDSGINLTIHSLNVDAKSLEISIQTIDFDGLIKETISKRIDLESNSEKILSVPLALENINYVAVYIDPEKEFLEPKENNFIRKSVNKKIKAYLDIGTGLSKIDSSITNFLGNFVDSSSLEDAEIVISVGKFSKNVQQDIFNNEGFINENNWGYKNEKIFVEGNYLSLPYEGVIGSYKKQGKNQVIFLGTEIDGTIASLKKLNSLANIYLGSGIKKENLMLNKFDLDALGVYDILHNQENSANYLKNNDYFKITAEKILNENSYDISIREVKTTSIPPATLRIKNLKPEFSEKYKKFISPNSLPVVFSGGLWSDLSRWEEFGKELASSGKNVWLIEITGGPLIERETDSDYNYPDLVDSYWPASMGAIQYYTNQSLLQYVGFSNGCRVALSSLEKYQEIGKTNVAEIQNLITGEFVNINLNGGPVIDTFVGIGCPGAFEGNSFLIEKVKANPNSVEELRDEGLEHVTTRQVGLKISPLITGILVWKSGKISLNLWESYNKLILNSNDLQPGIFNTRKASIIYGYGGLDGIGNEQNDGLVTADDAKAIANNINSTNVNKLFGYKSNHKFLPDNKKVKKKIKEALNGFD